MSCSNGLTYMFFRYNIISTDTGTVLGTVHYDDLASYMISTDTGTVLGTVHYEELASSS